MDLRSYDDGGGDDDHDGDDSDDVGEELQKLLQRI